MTRSDHRWEVAYIGAVILVTAAAFSYRFYGPTGALVSSGDASGIERLAAVGAQAIGVPTEGVFTSGRYGISFQYPASYVLSQGDLGTATLLHHQIKLKDDSGEEAVVIDMYENRGGYESGLDFISAHPNLDWRLDGLTVRRESHDGYVGTGYDWTAPYRGRSFIVARRGFVYVFSATEEGSDALEHILSSARLAE